MDVYGLIGNPVGHSLSPPLHEAAYDALGLDARYVTFEPAPDRAVAAVEAAETLGVAGLNVTVPFKEDVVSVIDPDHTARRVGAVNTIDFTTDPPAGYNTDVAGVRRALANNGADPDGRDVVVVGAGGAGRAIAFAVAPSAASVHVANRTPERATRLVADLRDRLAPNGDLPTDSSDSPALSAGGLGTLSDRVPGADLLINATTVGMEEDETPVSADLLHDSLTVMDAVYQPLDTRLLREARAAGATTIDGAWMLLYQAAEALELWTDEDAPVERMNDRLRSLLRE